ncbi:hypothetical protein B0H13DRAFT_1857579 [Mycena leptocephala]|nr:hypothetical protein B0H13DRAFT_1857579 [Mycena leptocephala]
MSRDSEDTDDSHASEDSFEWIEPNEGNINDFLARAPTHEALDAEALRDGILGESVMGLEEAYTTSFDSAMLITDNIRIVISVLHSALRTEERRKTYHTRTRHINPPAHHLLAEVPQISPHYQNPSQIFKLAPSRIRVLGEFPSPLYRI